jgi:hypothetical protein
VLAGTAPIPLAIKLPTAIGGAAAGAVIGSFIPIPGIGTAIGAAIGLVAGFIEKAFAGNAFSVPMSQAANQAEVILQQNLAAWQSLPAEQKTGSMQAAAENNFTVIWQWYVAACNQIIAGDPNGSDAKKALVRSIADRDRGGKFDWYALYYDPIANDPQVTPDTPVQRVTGAFADLTSGNLTSYDYAPLAIVGAILLGVLIL